MSNFVLLKEGQPAFYKIKNKEEKVFLCSIKRDQYNKDDFIFYLKNVFGEYKPRKYIASATIGTCLVLENPIFVDEYNYDDCILKLNSKSTQVKITQESNSYYSQLKKSREEIDQLRKFFYDHIKIDQEPLKFDDEQLQAILSNKNTLVTARAGSGKTRVIVGKIIKLLEIDHLKPNQIIAFTFNKVAKEEINRRLNVDCLVDDCSKYESLDLAKTFHSFARNLLNRNENSILEKKSNIIKLIINDFKKKDENIKSKIYEFFRKETLRIDRKSFSDMETYYNYIRNSKYVTLNNENVKSRLEKIIADFLFEHDINYIYEASFYPNQIDLSDSKLTEEEKKDYQNLLDEKKETYPDFYLPDYNIIWEHWAITGNESETEKINFGKEVCDYQSYLSNKEWKRKFWDKKRINKLAPKNNYNEQLINIEKFLETNHEDYKNDSREVVEKKLEQLLKKFNIPITKLPAGELENKVWEKRIDGFTDLVEQFVNKLQQNYFDNIKLFESNLKNTTDERARIFYKICCQVYNKYIEILHSETNEYFERNKEKFNTDFNELIFNAAKKIESGEVDDSIKNLKWILIDEYQDFSKLFDYLIQSILKRNPSIKVFCVGDDWQAINRYAGSNLKYYNGFLRNFKDSIKLDLSTNYRSSCSIVDFANDFAKRFNFQGRLQTAFKQYYSIRKEWDISKTFINNLDKNNKYINLVSKEISNKQEKAKYLFACEKIIKENIGSKIFILCRSNTLLGMEIKEFDRLLRCLCQEFMTEEEYKKYIFVKTVHTSKGEEADVVILLNVNEGSFPIYNSNNTLFEVFDETIEDFVKDEERLYYVALTRAKEKLYIYYRDKNKSSFISDTY